MKQVNPREIILRQVDELRRKLSLTYLQKSSTASHAFESFDLCSLVLSPVSLINPRFFLLSWTHSPKIAQFLILTCYNKKESMLSKKVAIEGKL
jgi:hypothetical protein